MIRAQEGQAYAPPRFLQTPFPEASGVSPSLPSGCGVFFPFAPPGGCGRAEGSAPRPGAPGPATSGDPTSLPALPGGRLDFWSQECRGLLVGTLIGNRKTWHSFPASLGWKAAEGLPFTSPAPKGRGQGDMVIWPWPRLGPPSTRGGGR